ncbi:MAG: DUF1592 domain-containing protein [Myxococcota bacterium]
MNQIAPLAAICLAACTGTIGDNDAAGRGGPDGPGSITLDGPPDCSTVGPRMIRRLSSEQLDKTLVALFDDETVPLTEVLTDPLVNGFRVDATEAVIRDLNAQQIMVHAERVAVWAVENKLSTLSSCQTADATCYRSFVETFGRRVYRTPVPAASVESYLALAQEEPTFADGIEAVLSVMLQSPYLYYRQERGLAEEAGTFRLSPDEVAVNLAYTLTDGPPDETLVQAAAEGRLATPEDLAREAQRLLQSAASDERLTHFVEGWVETDDLRTRTKLDPENRYSETVADAMLHETSTFFREVVRSGGDYAELLTASYTYIDSTLAGYYGVTASGDGFTRVALTDTDRPRGLLGQGSFLARHSLAEASSPVQRGYIVSERFLCRPVPDPPPGIVTDLEPITEPTTTRARYETHLNQDTCRGCHVSLDPIGFTFENFDAFARHRDTENGFPIDATGEIADTDGTALPLANADALIEYLAESEASQSCFAGYLSYYAYGLDGCNPEAIATLSGGPDASVEDLIVAIVQAPHFTQRRAE